ncbi:MAG: zinc ribbon domain-containing protein [Acidobacteriota bacterium]|nr:zinc ribbon domain-containing protein [Acidobacteriota bacterium]
MAIRRCPYCKAIIDESQKYCNNCGTQLLFPVDEQDEEPIKGEKIIDEDFKDVAEEDDSEDDDRLMTKDEADLQEIDLEEVLEGSGSFPGESKPKSRAARPSLSETLPPPAPADEPPAKPARRAAARTTPRAAKKSAPAKAKLDTKEEIAKLIAVLEEKERLTNGAVSEAMTPEPPAVPEADRKPGLGAAWEDLLRKPPSVDLDAAEIEIPRIPDTSPEDDGRGIGPSLDKPFQDVEDEDRSDDRIFAPPSSLAPGDTMDFQSEVLARTPLEVPAPLSEPDSEPTRMGIPERITREEIFEDRDEHETPPESVFDDLRFKPAPATPATAELLDEEPEPRRRLGFFRKTAALFFDAVFIGGVWALTLWLAAKLMGVALPDLLEASPVAAGILLAALLGSYFFLFLFFLGETLGDRMASRKS